jgi:hypothetical protein
VTVSVGTFVYGIQSAEDRCAIRNVPDEWWCRTEEWDYGDLYGGKRMIYTRCADPLADQYITNEIPPKPNRMCGYLWDEQGGVIDDTKCSPGQGDSQVGYWAGKEAEEADNTLNDNGSPASPPGRSLLPNYGSPDPRAFPENSPGESEEPISILVDVITNLLNGKSSSVDPQASTSVVTAESRSGELKNISTGKKSVMVNDEYEAGDANPRDAAGSPSLKDETDAASEGAIPSLAREAASGDKVCHDVKRPCDPQVHGNSGQKSSGDSMQDGRSANRFWPTIPGRVREAMGFVADDDGADGWLSAVVSLTGLGIAGGAFALRTRFLR